MIPIKKSLKKQPTKQMQHKKTKPKNQNAIQTRVYSFLAQHSFHHSGVMTHCVTRLLWSQAV